MATLFDLQFDGPVLIQKERGHNLTWMPRNMSEADLHMTNMMISPGPRPTLMLKPLQLSDDWGATTSGRYARFRRNWMKSTADSPPNWMLNWTEYQKRSAGDYWIEGKDPASTKNEVVYIATPLPANQGVCIEFFIDGLVGDAFPVLQLQYGQFFIEVQSQGFCWVHLGDFDGAVKDITRTLTSGWLASKPINLCQKAVKLFLMPYRRNSILLWSDIGDSGIEFRDDTLPYTEDGWKIDESPPVVVNSGLFKVKFSSGKASFSLSPLAYPEEGEAYGPIMELPYAPISGVGKLTTAIDWDVFDGNVVALSLRKPAGDDADPDTDASFILNGTDRKLYWYLVVAVDEYTPEAFPRALTFTPFIYKIALHISKTLDEKGDAATGYLDYVKRIGWNIGEGADQRSLDIEFVDAQYMSSPPGAMRSVFNRRTQLNLSPNTLFEGMSEGLVFEDAARQHAERGTLHVPDSWGRIHNVVLVDEPNYGGQIHTEVVKQLLAKHLGMNSSYWDIDDDVFALPYNYMDDDQAFQPANGTRLSEFFEYIRKQFSGWRMGFEPDADSHSFLFKYKNPDWADNTPVVVFDPTNSGLGVTCRTYHEETIPPEANQIVVIGFTPYNKNAEPGKEQYRLRAEYNDYTSQDPDVPEADRPLNWLGEVRRAVLVDDSLQTQDAVNWVGAVLADLCMRARKKIEFVAEFQPGLWVGDYVTITGYGNWKITGISTEIVFENEDTTRAIEGHWRPTLYKAERYVDLSAQEGVVEEYERLGIKL